jgi:PAS domain S-box-containing protein
MQAAPPPENEAARLGMLQSLDLLDRPCEAVFADYVALAARLADAPTALVSLTDERRQWFAGRLGADLSEIERSISFCAHAINRPHEVMWVEDALQDQRFSDSPLVVDAGNVRFYAGAPLNVNGFAVGTLCVLSPEPRPFDPELADALRRLAGLLAERLEKRHRDHALQRAMEVTVDAVIECDEAGIITDWRLGSEALFGYSAEEAVGQPVTIIIPPELRQAHLDGMKRWHEAGMSGLLRTAELAAIRKDGGSVDVELAMSLWRSHGRPLITTTIRDISERMARSSLLLKAKMEAEAANVAKSAFIANISHEIRTPLNGVVGVVDLLAATANTPKQIELIEIIRRSASQLQQLLGDVLDIARIESGRLALAEEEVSIVDLVSAVGDLSAIKARDKGLQFSVDIAPAARKFVSADPVRLKQILTNLVSNAVKFTEKGFVRITVSASDGRFRFEVQDSGIGFSEQERQVIFSRFEQAQNSISHRFGGAGLGLAICRDLVAAMGGSIDCSSRSGEGATFWFEVPLTAAASDSAVDDDEAQESGMGALRVLLADDNATNRRVAELILGSVGADVRSVENGAEACEAFEAGAFDIVLMDMMMPVMDGVDAVAAIRALEAERRAVRTPVVMLTANTLPEHLARSLGAGADLHVPKPITAAALLAAISSALDASIV